MRNLFINFDTPIKNFEFTRNSLLKIFKLARNSLEFGASTKTRGIFVRIFWVLIKYLVKIASET